VIGTNLNIPIDHHYVPRSFFKPWSNSKQWLWVYERKDGIILPPYPRSTKSICVQKGLYSYTDDVNEQQRNAIEQKLLSLVDGKAATVLQKLYYQEDKVNLSDQERYYFAVFVNSLRIRTPEAFAYNAEKAEKTLRNSLLKNEPRPEGKDAEEALDGQTLLEWVEKNNPKIFKNFGHELMAKFIINDKFVNRIMQMSWLVLKRTAIGVNFLTSDRPLVLIGNAESGNFAFALAISPEKIFIATSSLKSISVLLKLPPKKFIQQMNISTIQQAKNKAFAVDISHSLNFFNNRLGVHHQILPWTSS
jgi:hypothetical protein